MALQILRYTAHTPRACASRRVCVTSARKRGALVTSRTSSSRQLAAKRAVSTRCSTPSAGTLSRTETMTNHGNGRANAELLASSAQVWRLNSLGFLRVVREDEDRVPIGRQQAKDLLSALAEAGAWTPQVREGKR